MDDKNTDRFKIETKMSHYVILASITRLVVSENIFKKNFENFSKIKVSSLIFEVYK